MSYCFRGENEQEVYRDFAVGWLLVWVGCSSSAFDIYNTNMALKISERLNVLSTVLTLLLVIFLISGSIERSCFGWVDYSVAFGTLFANLVVSILAASGI